MAYFCLVIGALWLALAIFIYKQGFGIAMRKGTLDLATIAIIFRIAIPTLLFGWVAPAALGLWLLWKRI